MTEPEYLARQAQQAREAMSQTLHDMADALKEGADPRAWTQQYPWVSLGTAAALGFFMASALTPAQDESLKHRIQSLFPEKPAEPGAQPGPPADKPQKSTLWTLAAPLFDALKPALVSAVSSMVTAKAQQSTMQAAQDGGVAQEQEIPRQSDPTAPV